jgi:hypothetical protein
MIFLLTINGSDLPSRVYKDHQVHMYKYDYSTSSLTTIWSENFESVNPPNLPNGWTAYDGNNDGYKWKTYHANSTCGLVISFSTQFACYNDDTAGSNSPATTEKLTTAKIPVPKNYAQYYISFNLSFQVYLAETVDINLIYKSGNNNPQTLNIARYTQSVSSKQTIDISQYISRNNDTIQIEFVYRDGGNWGYGAGIDNVSLLGSPFASSDVEVMSISPTGLIPNQTVPIKVKYRSNDSLTITNTKFYLKIFLIPTNVLVFSDSQTVPTIQASSIDSVTFNFTPSDRKKYKVLAYAYNQNDSNHSNDTTTGGMRTLLILGDIVSSWTFPNIGSYSFAGITYDNDSSNFYVVAMNPARIFKFKPTNPGALSQISWSFHTFFPGGDIPWGIAYINNSFYITHVGFNGNGFTGCVLAKYNRNGTWSGDSADLWSYIETYWFAGMDWDYSSHSLWMVNVGGTNKVYLFDPINKVIKKSFDNPTGISYRAMAIYPEFYEGITGGWNQGGISSFDMISFAQLGIAYLGSVADVAIYKQCSNTNDPIYAFVTLNDQNNTILKIATGHYCDELIAVNEKPTTITSAYYKNGYLYFNLPLKNSELIVYSINGAKIKSLKIIGNKAYLGKMARGVYIYKSAEQSGKFVVN